MERSKGERYRCYLEKRTRKESDEDEGRVTTTKGHTERRTTRPKDKDPETLIFEDGGIVSKGTETQNGVD